MKAFRVALLLLSLAAAACEPIHTDHTFDYAYPRPKHDFTMRWVGTAGGSALWISTADDGEKNGRYEGVHLVVDPGGPTDVETSVLPLLAKNGVKAGADSLAYVVLTSADAQSMAGAQRLASEFKNAQIVAPGRPPTTAKGKAGPSINHLNIGPEISARLLRPAGAASATAQAIAFRFIDIQFLIVPGHADGLAGALAEEIGHRFEKEGVPTTGVFATRGSEIPAHALEHLSPELVVGKTRSASAFQYDEPAAGEVLEIFSNGSEMRGPGPRTRSRYGHWVDCTGTKSCVAELILTGAGLVPVKLAGQDEGLFLLDTRAPFSYLVRPRFQKIPGWESASGAGHSHGAESIGLAVPSFALGSGDKKVTIHSWHVLPIEPFQVGGKDVAGVIGMDLLQSFRLELQPKDSRILWTPNFDVPRDRLGPAESKTDGGRSQWDVPMDRSPLGPLILATMDGEPKSLIVDLAAERTRIYVRPDAWPAKVLASEEQTIWAFDVPDEIDEAAWKKYDLRTGSLTIKELNLFGAKFSDAPPALAVDRPLDADVLGFDFLKTFDRVSLDFRRRSILLERG